jgi:hypothetical protein
VAVPLINKYSAVAMQLEMVCVCIAAMPLQWQCHSKLSGAIIFSNKKNKQNNVFKCEFLILIEMSEKRGVAI